MAYTPTYFPQAYGNFNMPQMPQAAPVQQNTSPIWVQGEAGAKSYIVAPGSSLILMDSEGDFFYMKAVDVSGMPTLRKFEYKEVGNTPPPTSGDFVARSEFEQFKAQIESMFKQEVTNEQSV